MEPSPSTKRTRRKTPFYRPFDKPPTSTDGFLSPNRPAKKAKLTTSSQPISTSNQFESLTDNEYTDINTTDDDSVMEVEVTKTRKSSRQSATKNAQQPLNAISKMKPIVVSNIGNEEVQNMVKACSQSATYAKKYDKFHILTTCAEDKSKTIELLKEKAHSFHTYSESRDRHNTYVLRNHYRCSKEEMLNILKAQNIAATHVEFLIDNANPLYLVRFEKNGPNVASLNIQHKIVNHLVVKWEHFKNNSKKPTQCKNCQLWGHAASNCGYKTRCVKCLESHARGECARKDKLTGQPSCVNCGKSGHPSNSPTFSEYIKHVTFLESRMKAQQPRRFTSTQAPWIQHGNVQPTQPGHQRFGAGLGSASEYPPLSYSEHFAHSSKYEPRPNVKDSYKPKQDMPRNVQYAQNSTNNFSEGIEFLQTEANQIPFLADAIQIALNVINLMKNAKNPDEAAAILLRFILLKKCE